ncbi:MAG: hypothetical protein KF846_08345 [Cyclobacteriaceae bacterium]|nr:hypothetical protein [Cyclobacteriaceae bacterium]
MKSKTQSKPSAWERWSKPRIEKLNTKFNGFPQGTRKSILIVMGVLIAILCGMMVFNAIYGVPANPVSVDKITLSKDIYMPQPGTQTLTPIGKMKGEIDGEFEAFYLAVDKNGQVYINHNPEYGEDRYDKSKGWEPVTHEQLEVYEGELHFIPHHKKSLKP